VAQLVLGALDDSGWGLSYGQRQLGRKVIARHLLGIETGATDVEMPESTPL
jgi:hypothetical protein